MDDKHAALKAQIADVFHRHKGRYGYRRVAAVVRTNGQRVNRKTVQRLMGHLKLKCTLRPKRYRSYKGSQGPLVPDHLKRAFTAERMHQHWVTDVTEFNVGGEKLFLSPIMDLYNREIIAYETSTQPSFPLVGHMLRKTLRHRVDPVPLLLHSDQGWQYQMVAFRRLLAKHGVTQSMSRKGNCLDNAAMESFFAILKSEMFHGVRFANLDDLAKEIARYIDYYNHDRIKLKLDDLSPVQYRIQATATIAQLPAVQ